MNQYVDIISKIKKQYGINDIVNILGITPGKNGKYFTPEGEKTASVMIYHDTDSFFDFSAGVGGDQIDLFKHYRCLPTADAVKELASKADITIKSSASRSTSKSTKKYFISDRERELFEERAAILEYEGKVKMNKAEEFAYQYILQKRRELQRLIFESLYQFEIQQGMADDVLNYLTQERNLNNEVIEKFKLFSLKDPHLAEQFLRDCFQKDELIISGLFSRYKFAFTNYRIIIPYLKNDRIIFLRGRYFANHSDNGNYPKYLSPNNISKTLSTKRFFNIDVLDQNQKEILICEGEFDTILANQLGCPAIGIPGVNSFPFDQIKKLKNSNIYFLFDRDSAGDKAVDKISSELSEISNSIKKWILPEPFKDLTEYVNGTT